MKEWGMPDFPSDNECWICGHSLFTKANFIGVMEIEPEPNNPCLYDRFLHICPICAQVQLLANTEVLHKENPPNCHKPIKRMFLVKLDKIHITAWEVLDKEPWLKVLQDSKEEPVLEIKNTKEEKP
jgi:hypothetical protein